MSPEPPPLSIGVVVGSVSRQAGGLFNSVRRSALALAEAGCTVGVYALEDQYAEADLDAWRPLQPRVFRPAGPRRIGYAPDLGAALAQGGHDVVHLHGLWQLLSAQASGWRRATGRPLMISPRGMLDPWALRHSGLKKRVAARLFEAENLRHAHCLHGLSASEALAMRSFGLTNPVAVIPNGADLPDGRRRARPSWMTGDDRSTLLFLGRLHPKKGLKELISAWARLRQDSPATTGAWRLALAGWDDGGCLAELRRLTASLSLETEIVFPGPLFGEDKEAALAHAAAFVLPSFSEGLPMAVLEAFAHGRAVFMTEACNLPEAFAAGAAIRISTEPEALARQLADGLARPDLAMVGARGRALVRSHYSWAAIAQAHIGVYRWMRDGGAAPACVALQSVQDHAA